RPINSQRQPEQDESLKSLHRATTLRPAVGHDLRTLPLEFLAASFYSLELMYDFLVCCGYKISIRLEYTRSVCQQILCSVFVVMPVISESFANAGISISCSFMCVLKLICNLPLASYIQN